MAYRPSLKDIEDIEAQAQQSAYQPSMSDVSEPMGENISPIAFGANSHNPSFTQKLPRNVLAGMLSLGHNLVNAPSNIAKYAASKGMIKPETAQNIYRQEDYDPSEAANSFLQAKLSDVLKGEIQPIKTEPLTTADKVVQGLAANSPSIMMPAMRLGQAGKLISKIPAAGKYLEGALGRILPQAGFGAVTSENPVEGAATMAAMQGVGEAIPAAISGLRGVAELGNPRRFAAQIPGVLEKDYGRALKKAGDIYNPIVEKYGELPILPKNIKYYKGFNEEMVNHFTPKAKKLYQDFKENPIFSNAHSLKSQLGSEIAELPSKAPDAATLKSKQAMKQAQDEMKKGITSFLERTSPKAAQDWKRADYVFATEAAPYRKNRQLYEIAKGERKTIGNKALENLLTKVTEKHKISDEHPISQALDKLSNKVSRGEALGQMVPPVVKNFSPFPNILGALNSHYADVLGKRLDPHYNMLKNSIIASQFGNMNE